MNTRKAIEDTPFATVERIISKVKDANEKTLKTATLYLRVLFFLSPRLSFNMTKQKAKDNNDE